MSGSKVELLLKELKDPTARRYLIAGGSAFVTEYLLFLVTYKVFGLQVYVANSLSFCTGLLVSFSLNRLWAFRSQDFRLRGHHQFALYATLAIVNLFLINLIVGILKAQGLNPLIGKLFAMIFIVCWNFFIFKKIIFKTNDAAE